MNTNEQMRDAIGKILWCCQWMYDHTSDESVKSHLVEPIQLAKAALAAPPRNCDVGTAEEQWKRFDEFCIDWEESGPDGGCSDGCPCMAIKSKESDGCFGQSGCFSIWAQMPYEAAEGGAK